MPSKVTKTKKTETKSASKSSEVPVTSGGAVLIAKPTLPKGNGSHDNVYDDAVKEIVALSENDSYARKVDNGPLAEARGKDTWRLHAQLRATDQVNATVNKSTSALKTAMSTLDEHLHTDTVAVTELVERHGSALARGISKATGTLEGAVTECQTVLTNTVEQSTDALKGTISKTQTTLHNQIETFNKAVTHQVDTVGKSVHSQIEKFSDVVAANFNKLAKATAGSEENLRAQTQSFNKAVEELLTTLQNDISRKVAEFRDESTRQVDKRLNQVDVAFAAVRADQEVIKALLTDIIKDRMGRSEPRMR